MKADAKAEAQRELDRVMQVLQRYPLTAERQRSILRQADEALRAAYPEGVRQGAAASFLVWLDEGDRLASTVRVVARRRRPMRDGGGEGLMVELAVGAGILAFSLQGTTPEHLSVDRWLSFATGGKPAPDDERGGVPNYLHQLVDRAATHLLARWPAAAPIEFPYWGEGEDRCYLATLEWLRGQPTPRVVVMDARSGSQLCASLPGDWFALDPASIVLDVASDEVDRELFEQAQRAAQRKTVR